MLGDTWCHVLQTWDFGEHFFILTTDVPVSLKMYNKGNLNLKEILKMLQNFIAVKCNPSITVCYIYKLWEMYWIIMYSDRIKAECVVDICCAWQCTWIFSKENFFEWVNTRIWKSLYTLHKNPIHSSSLCIYIFANQIISSELSISTTSTYHCS